MAIVICDLDGTLADQSHRQHLIPDYRAYFAACPDDAPIWPVVLMVHDLAEFNEIYIVTGRSDEVREQTEAWLANHTIAYTKLLMRRQGDHRSDVDVKMEILRTIPRDQILVVLEDRKRVVDMWREQGLTCLQVADGDY